MSTQIDNHLGINSANVWAKGIAGSVQSHELTELFQSKKISQMFE